MTLADPATVRKALDVDVSVVTDVELEALCDAVDAVVLPLLTDGQDHGSHANCQEAAVQIAVQVWQSRYAPGGQVVGSDFATQTTPYLVGPGLVVRQMGLLGACMPYAGAVIA